MQMSKRMLVAICVLAGVGLTAGAIWFVHAGSKNKNDSPSLAEGASSAAKGSESAVRVETVPVTREDLKRTSEATPATIGPFESTDLYAKISGFLAEPKVDIGDRVAKGQVLVELIVPEMVEELKQKNAQVAQAEKGFEAAKARVLTAATQVKVARAGVAKAEADYERWQLENERVQKLVKSGGIEPEQGLETWKQFRSAGAALMKAQAEVESAQAVEKHRQAERDKAQADIGAAKADEAHMAALLDYAKVRAPFNGVVTKRNLHTGAFISAKSGEQMPIFTVVRTDLLRVTVDIPEPDVSYLDVKHPEKHSVHVKLNALPGQEFVWELKRFAPVLGAANKVRAEMEIQNTDDKFYPGMYGYATVVLQDKPGTLTLPVTCLSRDDKGPFVYAVLDGKAKKEYVGVGLNDGKKVEITSGLTGTQTIVANGKDTLRDGQAVEPVARK